MFFVVWLLHHQSSIHWESSKMFPGAVNAAMPNDVGKIRKKSRAASPSVSRKPAAA
jgi:hypothetical protein